MNRVLVAARLRVPPERDRAARPTFEPGLPPVLGDGGQLQQALLNLLLNAEQAMRARTGAADPRRRAPRRPSPTPSSCSSPIPATASRTRTCGGSSIRSSPRAKSAKAPGSASASATASSAITAGRFPSRAASARGRRSRCCCRRARATDEPLRALVAHRDATERDYVAAALTGWGHTGRRGGERERSARAAGGRRRSTWR